MNIVAGMDQSFFFTFKSDTPGFTDNLHQLRALHKLAVSIGGKYVHMPLVSLRSSANIYSFLGLEEGWKRNISDEEFAHLPQVELEFSEVRQEIKGIEQLQQFLMAEVRKAEDSQKTKPIIVLSGRRAYPLLSLINSTLPEDKVELNFKDRYMNARSRDPLKADFLPRKLKIFYHIRQGDTAIIETPWNTYISVMWNDKLRYAEQQSPEAFNRSTLSPNQFHEFATKLGTIFKEGSYSNMVFSDGYRRAFKKVFREFKRSKGKAMRKRRLKLRRPQIKALREISAEEDVNQFRSFAQMGNTSCVVGEGEKKLQRFLASVLSADILVIGPQQHMVQKLLALYHEPACPKIVIILSAKNDEPDHLKFYGLEESYIRSYPVNVNELNQDELKTFIRQITEELGICCDIAIEDE